MRPQTHGIEKPDPTWQYKSTLHTQPQRRNAKQKMIAHASTTPNLRKKVLVLAQRWKHSEIIHHSTNQRNHGLRNSMQRACIVIRTPKQCYHGAQTYNDAPHPGPTLHATKQSHSCLRQNFRTYVLQDPTQKTGHDLVQLATCSRSQQPSSATFLTAILNTNPAQSSSASISNKHSPQPSATSIPNRYYQQPFQQLQGNSK